MSELNTISLDEMVQQVKLSCQMVKKNSLSLDDFELNSNGLSSNPETQLLVKTGW